MAGLLSGLFCAPLSRERCATGRWLPRAQTSPLSLLSPRALLWDQHSPRAQKPTPCLGVQSLLFWGEHLWGLGDTSVFLPGCCF